MCKSCLQRYVANRTSSSATRTSFKVKKSTEEPVEQEAGTLVLTAEVKEVLAKKRRSGYVIPSARKRELENAKNQSN